MFILTNRFNGFLEIADRPLRSVFEAADTRKTGEKT